MGAGPEEHIGAQEGSPLTPALPPLVRPSHAQAPAVLDHSRTLAQGDGSSGPAFAGGAEGGDGKLGAYAIHAVRDLCFEIRSKRLGHLDP